MNRTPEKPATKPSQRRWYWLALLFFSVPTAVLFWEIVFAGKVLFWGVPLMQFVPWYQSVVDVVRGGELPLWNPLVGNGAPLLANYQTAVFYPPNWLIFMFQPARAMSWLMVLHVVWAGLGTWLYTRQLGLRPFARLVSALSFMFSGYLVSRLGFASIGSALPWLPWLFWAAERLLRRPALERGLVLGTGLGMQWLSGHAQTSFYSGLALGFYLIWRWLPFRSSNPNLSIKSRGRSLIFVLLALLLAIGILLVQLLPTAELQQLSQRSAGVETGFGLTYSLWPLRLIAFFTPRFFGHPATGNYWGYCCNYWEDNGYAGLLPLLLAIGTSLDWGKRFILASSCFKKRQQTTANSAGNNSGMNDAEQASIQRYVPFFAFMALVALVLAFGVHTPIYPWIFEHVPGFGQFQAPVRLLCLWTFGVSILAGIGAEMWRPTRRIRAAGRYGIVLGLAFLLAAILSGRFLAGNTKTFCLGIVQLGAGLLIAGLYALKQPHFNDEKRLSVWSILVLLFVVIDLVSAVWGANPTAEPWLYTRQTEVAATLAGAGFTGRTYYPADDEYRVTYTCAGQEDSCQRYLSFNRFGLPGTEYWFGIREALLPNTGILDKVPSANNFDPLLSNRYVTLRDAVDNAERDVQDRLLRMMGVEILITDNDLNDREIIHVNQDVYFSRIQDPLPRAFMAYNTLTVGSSQEALEIITGSDFDPYKMVVLEKAGELDIEIKLESEIDPQSLENALNNSIRLRTSSPSDGVLVLLDTYYPGWQVFVDGEPGSILPANLAFRGVPLKAGEHMVEFIYRPAGFRLGAALSGSAWLIIGCLFLLAIIHRRVAIRRKTYE
ncbi:MAG: YfhO family protein [Anaerolineales bacterium]|nr:YfhO family protein [Anaerolineales bacterium]